jgi:hypothetical protein
VVDRRGEVEVKVPRSGQVSVLVLLASVRSDRSVKAGALCCVTVLCVATADRSSGEKQFDQSMCSIVQLDDR